MTHMNIAIDSKRMTRCVYLSIKLHYTTKMISIQLHFLRGVCIMYRPLRSARSFVLVTIILHYSRYSETILAFFTQNE